MSKKKLKGDYKILTLGVDSKRKAYDESDGPKGSKWVKNSHTASPEQEKRHLKVVPFPEKVPRIIRYGHAMTNLNSLACGRGRA